MYNTVFVLIIVILVFGYVLGRVLDGLNLKHILPVLPQELKGIFDPEEYQKSQLYKRDNTRFSFFSSSLGLALMLTLFFTGGFGWLDSRIGVLGLPYILHVLLFFGILAFIGNILTTPLELYDTFVAEGTRYEIGTWDEAEGMKIFYNTFISTKIALVNMIQDAKTYNQQKVYYHDSNNRLWNWKLKQHKECIRLLRRIHNNN